MKKLLLSLLLVSSQAWSVELLIVNQVSYDFDTHIRVGVQAQVLEAPDATLVGQPAPYIQSLRYSASKSVVINQQFSSMNAVQTFMNDQLCKEIHEVTLNPIRDSGVKGNQTFIAKMKANAILVTGLNVTDKGKTFTKSLFCK